ncbi:MAG: pilin [Candidatus Doudnabacteria bacterium]
MQKKLKIIYFFLFYVLGIFSAGSTFAAVNFGNPSTFLIDWGGQNNFPDLLKKLINLGLSVAGLVAVAFIIIGGFQYMTSAGNEELAEAGKKTLINAIIGLVIIILSFIIVSVINNALG